MKDAANINSAPVALGAGSYDYDETKAALEKLSKLSDDKRDETLRSVLDGLDANNVANVDARAIDGYEFRDVFNEALGITERVQIFVDGDVKAQHAAQKDAPAPTETASTTKRSARKSSSRKSKAGGGAASRGVAAGTGAGSTASSGAGASSAADSTAAALAGAGGTNTSSAPAAGAGAISGE